MEKCKTGKEEKNRWKKERKEKKAEKDGES